MEITFDEAVEVLEIVNVDTLTQDELENARKKARKRWHPDRVAHKNSPDLTQRYQETFRKIDDSYQTILNFLNGDLDAGDAFRDDAVEAEPVDIIRENASDMQERLRNCWASVKATKKEHEEQKVQISDGFSLREMIQADLDDDIAFKAVISFIMGTLTLTIPLIIASANQSQVATSLVGFSIIGYWLCCLLSGAPLSRFWLPEWLRACCFNVMNCGIRIFDFLANRPSQSEISIRGICLGIIALFAAAIKWFLIWPLSQIAKLLVGDKRVGVASTTVHYYAGAAEWYIEDLIKATPDDMTDEELYHLSHLYSNLT